MAGRAASKKQLLMRKYKQLRRHKHPLTLEYEVNGQKIDPDPFRLLKNLKGWRDDEEIRDQEEEEEEEEHKHTLILNEDNKYDGDKFPSCELCDELILGPCYNCSNNNSSFLNLVDDECCGYYLHKSCAQEATPTMHHPIHPRHPLAFSSGLKHTCDSCRVLCNGFVYRCHQCDFDLDIRCAFFLLEHKIVNTSIHKHPLISLGREALLLCDACHTKHEGFFYFCTNCTESGASFFIHRNCALLPSTIKHRYHPPHHLNLSYSLPTQYSQFYPNCKICSKWINPKYWSYYCGGCRYFVHVHCATLLKEDGIGESSKQHEEEETSKTDPCCEIDNTTYDDLNVIRLPLPDEYVSVIRHSIKHMTLEVKKAERTKELHHDSHNHPLILHNIQSKYNSCSSRKSSLSSVEKNDRIYNFCAQCNFSLHKFCAALPTEVRYPGHPQHSLILHAKASTSLDWSCCHYCQRRCIKFRLNLEGCKCEHCSPISDDSAFYCASCKFFVHINCAFSPGAISHESHPQHVLILKEEINCMKATIYTDYCNACGIDIIPTGTAFECKTCSFKLHILCAYFPRRVEHRYDKHPFTLTYSPLEDHPDEYLCEICEREINPDYWFYHCAACDQSLHIDCIT